MSDYDNYGENLAFDPSKATTMEILDHRFDDSIKQIYALIIENHSLSLEIRRIQFLVRKLNEEIIELQLINSRKDREVRALLSLLETSCPQFDKWIDKNFKEYRDDQNKSSTSMGII